MFAEERHLSDDDKAAVIEAVNLHVRSGFYGTDEIAEIIDETILEPGEVDRDWLRAVIADAFAKKQREEAKWPKETDCDRLDQLFDALNEEGIIALQNAGYTQSDGLSDVTEAYREAGGEQSDVTGYCFYHGQDLERVVEGGDLWLTFGDIGGDDDKGTRIGHRIKTAAESKGFKVDWGGSIKTRLLIKGIDWKRRSGRTA
jgi:hypothetical protein